LLFRKAELPGTHDWYGKKGLLAGIPFGIRVSHLNKFRDPSRPDGCTDLFTGSSLRQIDFLFDSRGQQSVLLYERLSSWIRRLRGEDDTYTAGCGPGHFETCPQGYQV
jgi:hypothetical protein